MAADTPSVKTTGGGPSSKKRASAGGNPFSPSWSKCGNPVMTVCGGQSGCLSAISFENRANTSRGECMPSNKGLSRVGGSPISDRNRCQGSAQERAVHLRNRKSGPCSDGPRNRSFERNGAGARIGGSKAEKNPRGPSIEEAQGMHLFSTTRRAA